MSKELYTQLMAVASKEEGRRLKVAYSASIRALKEYSEESTASRQKDLLTAEELFRKYSSELLDKYFPESDVSDRFANRKQALTWLNTQGFKVSQGKFYQDCGEGFPAVHRDGSVSRFQVMEYGQRLSTEASPKTESTLLVADFEQRKAKAEAEMAEMKAERMRREGDRLWLHADDAWAQVAAVIGTIRDAIRHHLYGGQREIVVMAGGDQDRSQEVYECVDQLVNKAFNEVAGAEINVQFERDVE